MKGTVITLRNKALRYELQISPNGFILTGITPTYFRHLWSKEISADELNNLGLTSPWSMWRVV